MNLLLSSLIQSQFCSEDVHYQSTRTPLTYQPHNPMRERKKAEEEKKEDKREEGKKEGEGRK